jgi:hypothetical protein
MVSDGEGSGEDDGDEEDGRSKVELGGCLEWAGLSISSLRTCHACISEDLSTHGSRAAVSGRTTVFGLHTTFLL